jgi:hypothetical protein
MRSTPQTRFATSSRNSTTSSIGLPSNDCGSVGSISSDVSAGSGCVPATSSVNIDQRCQLSSVPRPAGSIHRRSPKTLVTASPSTFAMMPTGRSTGIVYQSLPYTSANSTNKRGVLQRSRVGGEIAFKNVEFLICPRTAESVGVCVWSFSLAIVAPQDLERRPSSPSPKCLQDEG